MTVVSAVAGRLGMSRSFCVIGPAYIAVDRLLGGLTGGRLVALGQRDLPLLLSMTTGRRTNAARTTPLMHVPDGGAFAMIGSNLDVKRHPDWSANPLAHPIVQAIVRGKTFTVRARVIDGAERERLRELLIGIWPGYSTYEQQADRRRLRFYRLEQEP